MNAPELWTRLVSGLALILSNGAVVGLLTATDALEAIMGDIEDPLDEDADLSAESRRLG